MPGGSDRKFDKLIARLYDAALDGGQIAPAFDDVARAFDATTSLLLAHEVRSGATTVLSSRGFSAAHLAQYRVHYWQRDLWADSVRSQPVNTAVLCSDLVPEKTFANSEIWTDYGRKIGAGIFRAVGASVTLDGGRLALIGLHRPKDAPDFARTDRELLNRLLPHLQRALQIRVQLNASLQRETLAYEALEVLTVPFVVARANATVVYANAAARMLAAQNDGLDLGSARSGIGTVRYDELRALHTLIAKTAQTTAARGLSAGGALNLSRPSKRDAYRVLVSPLTSRLAGGEALALLVIVDPEHTPTAPAAILAQLFGLTAAETRLALALASELTLVQAAEQFGVSFQTVRAQLRAIFAKTQTSRQAELMRLLSSLSIVC
jgi:DNA-binding CsgD family transcriptional regulator